MAGQGFDFTKAWRSTELRFCLATAGADIAKARTIAIMAVECISIPFSPVQYLASNGLCDRKLPEDCALE